jgi:hypothetical protein
MSPIEQRSGTRTAKALKISMNKAGLAVAILIVKAEPIHQKGP